MCRRISKPMTPGTPKMMPVAKGMRSLASEEHHGLLRAARRNLDTPRIVGLGLGFHDAHNFL